MSKVASEDTHSELSDGAPLPSVSAPLHSDRVAPPKASTPLLVEELETSSRGLDDDDDDSTLPLAGNPESVRLESKLDAWCLDLKRNVLVSLLNVIVMSYIPQSTGLYNVRVYVA